MDDQSLPPGADEAALASAENAQDEPEGLEKHQPSQQSLRRARAAQRGYYRWRRLSRMALAAFVILGAVTVVWLSPWMKIGLNSGDYTPQVAFSIYLLGGAALLAVAVLAFREFAQRDRELLLVWATVFDEATGLHNRTYFQDRLDLECSRGTITGEPFSVIVLQFRSLGHRTKSPKREGISISVLSQIARKIDTFIRRRDLLALLAPNELVLLGMDLPAAERRELEARLQEATGAALPAHGHASNLVVRVGGATFGHDGMQPGALIQAARTAANFGAVPAIKSA